MKKSVTEDRFYCDVCGEEAYEWTKCFSCGKDLCPQSYFDSNPNPHAVRYPHGVYTSGSDDGYYCIPCDIQLSESKADLLHQAYVAIRTIRDERERWYQEQKIRETKVEELVAQLLAKRKAG